MLSATAGPWEKVTEKRRTLGPLDGGHGVHPGFGPTLEECCGPSEDRPVSCICNSLRGPGGWLVDEWGYTKWLPGTAGDWAQGRRDPPVLQLVLGDTSGPSERGVPNQRQYAELGSIRMSVCQTVCYV